MRRYLIYFPLLFLTVSCEIIEEDISGRAVTTIAPADDAEVPAGETLFRWRAVDRAADRRRHAPCGRYAGPCTQLRLPVTARSGPLRMDGRGLQLRLRDLLSGVAAHGRRGTRTRGAGEVGQSRIRRTVKSRWTTCLLLAAVVAVWGVVAWRILAPARPAAPDVRPATDTPAVPQIVAETLRLDYPDPFLKGVAAPTPAARSVVRRLPPAGKAEPKRRERVQLSHLATVTAGGQALHILTIGGRQYELSLRDTAAGFRLTGADRDSLYLEREGTVYGVKRCDE